MVKSLRYHRCCSWVSSFWGIPPTLWRWQFLRIWNRNVVLLAFGKCYAQNTRFTTVIIDQPTPSTFGNRITFKNSTDTISQLVQFTDSHRFFWKGSQKANIVDRLYANEQTDTLLDRPLSDKARLHVTYSQPTQLRSAHILCLATDITLFGVGS
jgi:hypothetical protein